MHINNRDKPNFGLRMYRKAGKGGIFEPNHKHDDSKPRMVKIKALSPKQSESSDDEVELKG